jgi:nitroreductase
MTTAREADFAIADVFLNRWSPRSFQEVAVPEQTLLGFLEAARWAPSGLNVQPWRFVYALRGDAAFEKLVTSLWPLNQAWAPRASALVAVASTTLFVPPGAPGPVPNPAHAFDSGAAWAYLAMQAHLAGWQTHAMGGFDQAAAAEAIGLPSDHAIHAIIAVGKRGAPEALNDQLRQRETASGRRPLSGTAFRGAFPGA